MREEILSKVVVDEDEHDLLGGQRPHKCIVIWKLFYLAGPAASEGRGRDVQVGQLPDRKGFKQDIEFVGDRDLPRFHEGTADHGDMTACRSAFGAERFAIQKPQAVSPRDRPEIEMVRPADFRIRFQETTHFRNELRRNTWSQEWHRISPPNLSDARDHCQPDSEQQPIPADKT